MQCRIVNPARNTTAPQTAPLVIFAGGGSGGHLFPSMAIAERLMDVAPGASAEFYCSQRAIDRDILEQAGAAFRPLPAAPMLLRPFPAGPLRFIRGWRQSVRLAATELTERARTRPVAVALMGGFVAAPVARAAAKVGVPSILVNLDVAPGKANRLMARFSSRIISAVPCPDYPEFNKSVMGMPIRRGAVATHSRAECRARFGLHPDTPTLLVTGASQGAGTFNRLLIDLLTHRRPAFDGWQVLHLTGASDEAEVREAYAHAGVPARVLPFSTDMASAWGAADLALSRCGASSVAEALANCVPTLFSPYPWHRDQHQRLNAIEHVRAGRAWLVGDAIDPARNLEIMGNRLLELMSAASQREQVVWRLRSEPASDAAAQIAALLCAAAKSVGRP